MKQINFIYPLSLRVIPMIKQLQFTEFSSTIVGHTSTSFKIISKEKYGVYVLFSDQKLKQNKGEGLDRFGIRLELHWLNELEYL